MATDDIRERLAEPFPAEDLGWKPQSVKQNRALAVAYIDARMVEDRLDDVFGVGGWSDEYTPMGDGNVMCRLSVKIDGAWIVKTDVGGESEQPDGGDRLKAAFSDALKRAGVKLGIGRYLYDLPKQWCDFDPVKKCFTQTPQLPAKFLPKKKPATSPPAAKPQPAPQPPPPPTAGGPSLYDELADYLNAAASPQELGRVWDSCAAAKKANQITADDYAELAVLKDRAKTRLGMPVAAK
jgi:hypothetical protein